MKQIRVNSPAENAENCPMYGSHQMKHVQISWFELFESYLVETTYHSLKTTRSSMAGNTFLQTPIFSIIPQF